MTPKILISAGSVTETYVKAVGNCGGLGIAEYCPEPSEDYDGLILCGGGDVSPGYYNEEINGSADIDEKRDIAEFKLIKYFTEKKKPILGICRGCQVLNIAFGGTLYQNISNKDEHLDYILHPIKSTRQSFLSDIYGERFNVNSFHHQAIRRLGKNMEVIFVACDTGETVEAIMHKELPIIGVQWHPERICDENKAKDTASGSGIFKYFIALCKRCSNMQNEQRERL